MQPQEPLAPARRALDAGDYADMLRRHRSWIAGSLFVGLVASVVTAYLWPDTFVSVASIRLAPPQVPESFVPANVNVDLQSRVNSLVQLIENRATLTNIINTHGLYKRELARLPMDDVIDQMKLRDIRVAAVQQSLNQPPGRDAPQYPAFEIRFSSHNRFIAQKVATDLVARFLEENVREVSQQTVSTTQFLQDQWEGAKRKLNDLEQKLSVFRANNMGRLPEEQQNNYQQLNAMEALKLNLNLSMNRVNQEKLLEENQLRIYRQQLTSLADPALEEQAVERKNEKLADKEHEIAQLEDSLTAASERYQETHPDVQRLVNLLALARKQREVIASEAETKPADHPARRSDSPQAAREQRDLDGQAQRIQGLIQAKDLEMDYYRKQASQLDSAIRSYEARIQSTPVGIKEYDELIRDRDLAKKDYEDLDRRLNSSAMSTALQNRQQGERLEQLDPPSLPQTPAAPERRVIVGVGTGLGLLLGLCLAGLREMQDTALKNLKDVRVYTQLPILASIPLLENDRVVRRRKRLLRLAWSAACLAGVVVMSGSVAYYYATKL
jgi:succinoglycan biosynthesis transport protein ExoP